LSGALLDTSVVIGGLEPLQMDLPATMAISVITLGELRAGVGWPAIQLRVLLARLG
jgi:predicted nucleic acid-binding protein